MKIIMPLGTASWLIKNTKLEDKQIAEFCGISLREVIDLRAGRTEICAVDPINYTQQLTLKEIKIATQDPSRKLKGDPLMMDILGDIKVVEKPYTPSKLRRSKKTAIILLLKNYPMINPKEVRKLMNISIKTFQEYEKNLEELVKSVNLDDNIESYLNLNPLWRELKEKYDLDRLE
jgi:hypothetical protein